MQSTGASHKPAGRSSRPLRTCADVGRVHQRFVTDLIVTYSYSASIIMSVVYGYEPQSHNDPIVSVVKRAVDLVVSAVRPEVAALLGLFPFCKLLSHSRWRLYNKLR